MAAQAHRPAAQTYLPSDGAAGGSSCQCEKKRNVNRRRPPVQTKVPVPYDSPETGLSISPDLPPVYKHVLLCSLLRKGGHGVKKGGTPPLVPMWPHPQV